MQNYGLPNRVQIKEISKTQIAILKYRKSRIIMKDGKQILEQAKIIWQNFPKLKISLKTNAPVCSKTMKFLTENNVEIILSEYS